MQRGSVLVLTLLIISIEAGPYVNSTYTRLAFNKVGKAGGLSVKRPKGLGEAYYILGKFSMSPIVADEGQ